eukprot:420157-Rhodomonas_salina.1
MWLPNPASLTAGPMASHGTKRAARFTFWSLRERGMRETASKTRKRARRNSTWQPNRLCVLAHVGDPRSGGSTPSPLSSGCG